MLGMSANITLEALGGGLGKMAAKTASKETVKLWENLNYAQDRMKADLGDPSDSLNFEAMYGASDRYLEQIASIRSGMMSKEEFQQWRLENHEAFVASYEQLNLDGYIYELYEKYTNALTQRISYDLSEQPLTYRVDNSRIYEPRMDSGEADALRELSVTFNNRSLQTEQYESDILG